MNIRKRGISLNCLREEDQFKKIAIRIKKFNQTQHKTNLAFLQETFKQKNGFIRNCYEKKDFVCIEKLLLTHLSLFDRLMQQNQNLSTDFNIVCQQNQRKLKRIHKLKLQRDQLKEGSQILTECVLNSAQQQSNGKAQNVNKAKIKQNSRIKYQQDEQQDKEQEQQLVNLPIDFGSIKQFGQQYLPVKANPSVLNKYKSVELQKEEDGSESEESQIYSQLKIGKQLGKFSSQNKVKKEQYKIIKDVKPQKVTHYQNPETNKKPALLYKLPNQMQSNIMQDKLIHLPNNLSSKYNLPTNTRRNHWVNSRK